MNGKQIFYLMAALVGLVVTWYFNIRLFASGEEASFLALAYANDASTSLTNDLFVVVGAFLVWSWFEAKRLEIKYWWLYAVMTFGVAIAVTYPLFLFARERAMADQQS